MTLPEFEQRVWHRGLSDWHWEVRYEGLLNRPFASGTTSNPRAAKEAIERAVEQEAARMCAPWKPVKYDAGET